MFVETDDRIKVIAGREKDKEGTVIRVGHKNDRVVVKGLNMIKKHKKSSQTNQNDGVVGKEDSVHVSDVMLIDLEPGKPTRIGHETVGGNRVRIAKISGRAIDKE